MFSHIYEMSSIALFCLTSVNFGDRLKQMYLIQETEMDTVTEYFSRHPSCERSLYKLQEGVEMGGVEDPVSLPDEKQIARVGMRNLVRLRNNMREVFNMTTEDVARAQRCVEEKDECRLFVDKICKDRADVVVHAMYRTQRGQFLLAFADTLLYASADTLRVPPRRRLAEADVVKELSTWIPIVKQEMDIVREGFEKSTTPGLSKSISCAVSNATVMVEAAWNEGDTYGKVKLVQTMKMHFKEPHLMLGDIVTFSLSNTKPSEYEVVDATVNDEYVDFALTAKRNQYSTALMERSCIYVDEVDDKFWYPAALPFMRAYARARVVRSSLLSIREQTLVSKKAT
jgi:hypothetical protein